MADLANVAAQIHANMCNDSRFGYSWSPRWGTDGAGYVTWNIGGRNYRIKCGDYDCSSSIITAWQKALEGTDYEGVLDAATYTGNMRSVFAQSGLFDVWNTYSTSAVRGDVYLNDNSHTAMCQDGGYDGVYGYDALSEFSINENGGTYGGKTGDQTGREAYIHSYYSFPWSCTLHYNGRANTSTDPVSDDQPRYNAMVNGQWLPDMVGLIDTDGSPDTYAGIMGRPIQYIAIDGVKRYRVHTVEGGWLDWVYKRKLSDLVYGAAGDGSPILAVEIDDDSVKYRVHTVSDRWLPYMIGMTDTDGSDDTFAGNGVDIDAIEIMRA